MRKFLTVGYCALLAFAVTFSVTATTAKAAGIVASTSTSIPNGAQGYYNKFSANLPAVTLSIGEESYIELLLMYDSQNNQSRFNTVKALVQRTDLTWQIVSSPLQWPASLTGSDTDVDVFTFNRTGVTTYLSELYNFLNKCVYFTMRIYFNPVTLDLSSLLSSGGLYSFGDFSYYLRQQFLVSAGLGTGLLDKALECIHFLSSASSTVYSFGNMNPAPESTLPRSSLCLYPTISWTLPNYYQSYGLAFNLGFGVGDEVTYAAFVTPDSTYRLLADGNDLGGFSVETGIHYLAFSEPYIFQHFQVQFPNGYVQSGFSLTDTLFGDYGLRLFFGLRFNLYPETGLNLVDSVASTEPDYVNCSWYDLPCHLGNAFLYFLYVFPPTKGIFSLLNGVYRFLSETFGFVALWSGLGVVFSIFIVFMVLRIVRHFTS